MKLKNTLGLHICSLFNTVREDRPVVELYPEIAGLPRSWVLQIVVAGWVVHRLVIDYVESERASSSLITRPLGWFLDHKHHPNDFDGDNYIGPKLTRNGRGAGGVSAKYGEGFDIGQLPVRMIQSDVDSWIYDVNQPLPFQRPVLDYFAEQKIMDRGGFRRGEMVTFAAFSQPQHKVDMTKHYFHKV